MVTSDHGYGTFAPLASERPLEQRAFEAFLGRHPNITAYFHGNSNWNQFYDWIGPDHRVTLHAFRVDSPMKGAQSADDESRLSFHVASIDGSAHALTVRECLWTVNPAAADPLRRGERHATVSLSR